MHCYMKSYKNQAIKKKHNENNYILTADDDHDIVRLIEQASCRQIALAPCFYRPIYGITTNQDHCSFVLAEIKMPRMDGYEICDLSTMSISLLVFAAAIAAITGFGVVGIANGQESNSTT